MRYWTARVVVALGLTWAAPVQAQQIDPALLRQLQNQVQSQGQLPVPEQSPVDAAREAAQRRDAAAAAAAAGGVPGAGTSVDRVQPAPAPRPVAPIEADMRERTGNPSLRLFGIDLFRLSQQGAAAPALTGRLGDDYVLGVGDEVVVTFQGSTSRTLTTRVDREGRLIIDQLRPVPAAGRSFGAVRREVEAATRATILGTEVFLSVSTVRSVTVLVGGEVERPGQFSLTSLSDVSAAIARAGGILPTGSLRRVRVERAGRTITVDLYGLLGIGSTPAVRLQDGDRIIVPALGPVIAVAGSVNRPAIFELVPGRGTTLGEALAMAGGPLRSGGNEYVLSRVESDGTTRVSALSSLSATLRPGDAVMVNPRSSATIGNVQLSGYVNAPGLRSLTMAPTVRTLLGSAQNLRPGTYVPFAVLIRFDPFTRARQLQGIDLSRTLGQGPDVSLRSDDELVVLSSAMIDTLRGDDIRTIVLGQPNPRPACRSFRALEALVRDTQGGRFASALRGAFIVDRDGRAAVGRAGAAQTQLGVRSTDTVDQTTTLPENEGRAETALDANGCVPVFESNVDLMPFMLEHTAALNGAVRAPGAYPVLPGTRLSLLVDVAGGLSLSADRRRLDVLRRTDGEQAEAWQSIDLTQTQIAELTVSPGDDFRFVTQPVSQEAGSVLLSGEVARPGVYTIRRGETLSQLLARAGGLTQQAYAYGSVFTRRSVRAAQEEGFRRASRELSNGLLAMSGRRNVNAESIVAASALIRDLNTVESAGRMVVEADPRVIERRPDLDTVLEPGDALFVPKRPNVVLTLGDVLNPNAAQFIEGKSVRDYIAGAGGLQRSADDDRVFVVFPNGIAQPVSMGGWRRGSFALPPGSTVVVPKDIDPLRTLDLVRDVGTILSQFAVSVASVAVLARGN